MANRALSILESIRDHAGIGVYDCIIKTCGTVGEKATPRQQAKYIKSILDALENIDGHEVTARVMKPCGHKCISDNIVSKAKGIYSVDHNGNYSLCLLFPGFAYRWVFLNDDIVLGIIRFITYADMILGKK